MDTLTKRQAVQRYSQAVNVWVCSMAVLWILYVMGAVLHDLITCFTIEFLILRGVVYLLLLLVASSIGLSLYRCAMGVQVKEIRSWQENSRSRARSIRTTFNYACLAVTAIYMTVLASVFMMFEVIGNALESDPSDYLAMRTFAGVWGLISLPVAYFVSRRVLPYRSLAKEKGSRAYYRAVAFFCTCLMVFAAPFLLGGMIALFSSTAGTPGSDIIDYEEVGHGLSRKPIDRGLFFVAIIGLLALSVAMIVLLPTAIKKAVLYIGGRRSLGGKSPGTPPVASNGAARLWLHGTSDRLRLRQAISMTLDAQARTYEQALRAVQEHSWLHPKPADEAAPG